VTELGSIFEPEAGDGPRGRDLRHDVTVPAWAAGHDPGVAIDVPLQLPAAGGYVARAVSAHDPGTTIHVRLPAGFPSGGALRLRGQGEAGPGGRAGDLILVVHLDPTHATPPGSSVWSPLTWSPGQVLATSPEAPRALVVVVVLAFAVGAVIVFAL
jgi:hypothetical protein